MGKIVRLNVGNLETDLEVREFQKKRVITFRDVDELHERPGGTTRKRFNENKSRFTEGEDYFEITEPSFMRTLGIIRPQGGLPEKIVLLTESGYLMVVKSFTDDLAWQVQRTLINTYFRGKESKQVSVINSIEDLIIMQAQSIKELKNEVRKIREVGFQALERVKKLDALDITVNKRKQLRSKVIYFADKLSIPPQSAWVMFRKWFNVVFDTNLQELMERCEKANGIPQLTMLGYLELVNRLDDGLQIADEMLEKIEDLC